MQQVWNIETYKAKEKMKKKTCHYDTLHPSTCAHPTTHILKTWVAPGKSKSTHSDKATRQVSQRARTVTRQRTKYFVSASLLHERISFSTLPLRLCADPLPLCIMRGTISI